jgi:hypothetical protein
MALRKDRQPYGNPKKANGLDLFSIEIAKEVLGEDDAAACRPALIMQVEFRVTLSAITAHRERTCSSD